MVALQLEPGLERRLAEAATNNGVTAAEYLRELLVEHLEDLEDIQIAQVRLADPQPSIPAEQVWRDLGLDD